MAKKYTKTQWENYLERENKDFFQALRNQYNKCRLENITPDWHGRYETPKEKNKVNEKNGSLWLKFDEFRVGGKRLLITKMQNYKKIIQSYASFLRADGVENKEEMIFYILHFSCHSIKFFWTLNIEYEKTKPIIEEVVKWIFRKKVEDIDINKFIDKRELAVVSDTASKSDKIKVLNKARGLITDRTIASKYNSSLTIKENCEIIGCCPRRLSQWKKKNKEELENKEDLIREKINRLYNPSLTWKQNEELTGYSRNTIKKYLNTTIELSEEDKETLSEVIAYDDEDKDLMNWVENISFEDIE